MANKPPRLLVDASEALRRHVMSVLALRKHALNGPVAGLGLEKTKEEGTVGSHSNDPVDALEVKILKKWSETNENTTRISKPTSGLHLYKTLDA
ncbi:unnamed protein product [Toxocara canis]|uniref:Uncharacterized protein n=1 Tax=Toxocara canis TaxID=6265 RepID=A0A183VAU2_TOXCA|nr:unnamed protein product [Toxocara canis]